MKINQNSLYIKFIMSIVQHYNHDKYWKRRNQVVSEDSNIPKLLKLYYLFYIKRCDAFSNASFGTDLGSGAKFKTPPILPHHLNGIVISHFAKIGANVTIFQQVTIATEDGKAATIGDNVLIGAGAKIIGNVKIGDNVKIGANCIVVQDIPANSTVVMNKPRIIIRTKS